MKPGRNDPCPCGSGKKYKHCHLPVEEQAEAEQRRLRQAQDTLLPRLIDTAQELAPQIPAALERFWNGKYRLEQLAELDDLESRGAERFLSWLVFDYAPPAGQTLLETLAAEPERIELDEYERRLLPAWVDVRLRPYTVVAIQKGRGLQLSDLLNSQEVQVEDRAASRRLEPGELLIAQLLPVNQEYFLSGAVAQLTADTAPRLLEYLELYLEDLRRSQPAADLETLLRQRSELLNHFVMALPVEEYNPSILDNLLLQTRSSLQLLGHSVRELLPEDQKRDEER